MLAEIGKFTLASYSLLKRALSEWSLKEIKETLRLCEAERLVRRFSFPDFVCFALTDLGFPRIGIEHSPQYRFKRETAIRVCQVNHLRLGIESHLKTLSPLKLNRWISGSKFNRSPLTTSINGKMQTVRPSGLAVVELGKEVRRLYLVDWCGKSFEQLRFNLFFYFLYQERREFAFRFHVPPDSAMRVIYLVPSYRFVFQSLKYVKRMKGAEITLFLPTGRVHLEGIMGEKVFLARDGSFRSILK